jgi:putative toxin-antitoxin system antitoxin component (TIGR02293 family)
LNLPFSTIQCAIWQSLLLLGEALESGAEKFEKGSSVARQSAKNAPKATRKVFASTLSKQAKIAQQPADHSIAQLRESDIKDNAKMSDLVTRGIPLSSVRELGEKLAISQERLGELLLIPKRTFHRRVQKQDLLKQDESERVVRLFRLYFLAMEVFEDGGRALRWFASHPKALGGEHLWSLLGLNLALVWLRICWAGSMTACFPERR